VLLIQPPTLPPVLCRRSQFRAGVYITFRLWSWAQTDIYAIVRLHGVSLRLAA